MQDRLYPLRALKRKEENGLLVNWKQKKVGVWGGTQREISKIVKKIKNRPNRNEAPLSGRRITSQTRYPAKMFGRISGPNRRPDS